MAVADEAAFLAEVRPDRRFVLTTHVHPDGDGIGSEVALRRLLVARGAEVRIVNRDRVPPMLGYLDPEGLVETYDATAHDAAIEAADAIVMLDNSDPQRLEDMERPIRRSRAVKVCIDHHPDPDPFWDLHLVHLDAACTGVIVHRIFEAAGHALDAETATALYTALSSDTGRFRFGNTSAEGFRLAAALVDAGASPAQVYARLGESFSAGFLRLFGEVLASMEVRADGRLVVLRVPAALVARHAAQGEDLAEVINFALRLAPSRLAVLFRELAPQVTKVSLRSKGEVDVNRLARHEAPRRARGARRRVSRRGSRALRPAGARGPALRRGARPRARRSGRSRPRPPRAPARR